MTTPDPSASQNITKFIADANDWRGEVLARLRQVIGDASPDLVEDWKWGGPVWVYKGNVVALGAFKDHVKVNFFKGAALDDPSGLINAGLEAKTTRSIDIHQGEKIDEAALQDLVRSAVKLQTAGKKK